MVFINLNKGKDYMDLDQNQDWVFVDFVDKIVIKDCNRDKEDKVDNTQVIVQVRVVVDR